MRLFILEEDLLLIEQLKESLELQGHFVESFTDVSIAYENISKKFDIFFISLDIDNFSGIEILKSIKSANKASIVIMIGFANDINIINKTYANKCDDFIKKPFFIDEIIYKIKLYDNKTIIDFSNGLEYNRFNKMLLDINNEKINLTKKESLLFHLLATNKGFMVTKEQIVSYVWSEEKDILSKNYFEVLEGTLRGLVCRLRKKLPKNTIITQTFNDSYYIPF